MYKRPSQTKKYLQLSAVSGVVQSSTEHRKSFAFISIKLKKHQMQYITWDDLQQFELN
jgi:hypothetical protein